MALDGKVALVTGAANGIGAGTARRLAADGARVVLTDIEMDTLKQVADDLTSQGADVLTHKIDVTDRERIQQVFDDVVARWGTPNVIAHIAGTAKPQPYLELSDEDWQRTIDINLTGSFLVSQIAARALVAAECPGSIVFMASTNGLVGEEELADYNASKFGVVGLTKTLAIDLAPYNIRVNSVNPGLIHTRLTKGVWNNPEVHAAYTNERIPMRRLGTIDEVAACVAFLASDDSSFVTGHSLVVDGGQLTF